MKWKIEVCWVIEMTRKEYQNCFFYFETLLGEHWKDENSLYGKIAKVLGLSKSFTTFLLEEDHYA
jgi:hypothetical protein